MRWAAPVINALRSATAPQSRRNPVKAGESPVPKAPAAPGGEGEETKSLGRSLRPRQGFEGRVAYPL